MNRIATLVAMVATAGIIALKTMDISTLLPDPRAYWAQDVSQDVRDYYAFKAQFNGILDELANGQISLREAIFRADLSSKALWPKYLVNLKLSDEGKTPQERTARNIAGHIRGRYEMSTVSHYRWQTVEAELAAMLAEMNKASKTAQN